MKRRIFTVADVASFFKQLLEKESLNFHPDEDFKNYIQIETKLPSYTKEEAHLRNSSMQSCFAVCAKGLE